MNEVEKQLAEAFALGIYRAMCHELGLEEVPTDVDGMKEWLLRPENATKIAHEIKELLAY